jgi:vitamin K-dependent gamma-carboxylase-like protein
MIEALRRWRDETGSTHALRAARVVLGLLLLDSAVRAGRDLGGDYFGGVFHWPILPEALVLPETAYTGLVVAQAILAAMVIVGFRAREALFASAFANTYVLLCDRLQFHHNRWALACYSLLLALSPCDRRAPRIGPLWAMRLAQLQVAMIYLASGGSKLLDPDWRSGRVLAARLALYGSQAVASGVPQSLVVWLGEPGPAHALAALAISTELFLGIGLWPRRTRAFALWWGVWFHLSIEATSRVESFTWLTLAMYALFATPDHRARKLVYDPRRAFERAVARAVGLLDWLARFDIEPRSTGDLDRPEIHPHPLEIVGRDGTRVTRLRALAAVARCTPLLFPLWLPISALAALSGIGERH